MKFLRRRYFLGDLPLLGQSALSMNRACPVEAVPRPHFQVCVFTVDFGREEQKGEEMRRKAHTKKKQK